MTAPVHLRQGEGVAEAVELLSTLARLNVDVINGVLTWGKNGTAPGWALTRDERPSVLTALSALSSQAEALEAMARLLEQVAGDGPLDFMIGGNPHAIDDFNASVTDALSQYRQTKEDTA